MIPSEFESERHDARSQIQAGEACSTPEQRKHNEGSGDALLPQRRGKQYADSYTVT